jgi:superfamily II DNA or RNA helicase
MSDKMNLNLGCVYILKFPYVKGLFKIGKTNNIKNRISTLSTGYPDNINVENMRFIYPKISSIFSSGFLIEIEKKCHSILSDIHYNREFFTFNKDWEEIIQNDLVLELNRIGYNVAFTKNISDLKGVFDKQLNVFENDELIENINLIAKPRPDQSITVEKMISFYFNKVENETEIIGDLSTKIGKLIKPPGMGKSYIVGFYLLKVLKNYKNVLIFTPYTMICLDFEKAILHCGISEEEFKKITIECYQSLKKFKNKEYDLIIYDECHHLCSPEWKKTIEIKSKHKLFMTATEKVYEKVETKKEKCKDERDDECDEESESFNESEENESDLDSLFQEDEIVFDMDDKKFGEMIEKTSLEEAIKLGYLCDYKIYFADWKLGILTLIERLKTDYLRKKIVLFFNSLENAEKINKELNENNFKSVFLSSEKSYKENLKNRVIFEESDFCILCNVNIVSEGVSINCIDTIIFMEPTNSSIALVQKIGRALRKFKGKGFSMILGCEEMLLNNSLLKTISKFDSRVKNKDMILMSKEDLQYNLYDFENKMKIIEMGGEEYYKYRVECCIKISENNEGKFPSMYSKDENEKKLAIFIQSQKKRYKKLKGYECGRGSLLKDYELKILDTYLPFKEWMKQLDLDNKKEKVIISKEDEYKTKINECIKISKDKNGEFPSMTKHSKNENEKSLATFIAKQKQRYKKLKGYEGGRGTLLKDYELKILDTYLPFKEWMKQLDLDNKKEKVIMSKEDEYKTKINECMKISKDKNGEFPSRSSKDENEKSLATFIERQKERYKKLKGYGGEKKSLLKDWELGILNTYLPFKEWMKQLDSKNQKEKAIINKEDEYIAKINECMKISKDKNGEFPSRSGKGENEKKLCMFIETQKQRYKKLKGYGGEKKSLLKDWELGILNTYLPFKEWMEELDLNYFK